MLCFLFSIYYQYPIIYFTFICKIIAILFVFTIIYIIFVKELNYKSLKIEIMKIEINGIEIKITKKEIREAIKSELRFDFGVVASDVFSILVMTARNIDFSEKLAFTLAEQVDYFYANVKKEIENSAFHYSSIAMYFGLPKVK